jgi:hypothetical protein
MSPETMSIVACTQVKECGRQSDTGPVRRACDAADETAGGGALVKVHVAPGVAQLVAIRCKTGTFAKHQVL